MSPVAGTTPAGSPDATSTPSEAPASRGPDVSEEFTVPGVTSALFVEFCLETGKLDIPGALKHAQETPKFQQNPSFMDWLTRPGTNIWSQRTKAIGGS